jgi:glycerol-1-phosphate dehydrogenase [NAD(P)+]
VTESRHVDPSDLDAVRRAVGLDTDGSTLHPVLMDRIVIGSDALAELPAIVAALRRPGPVALVVDPVPMRRGGDDLKSLVTGMLAGLEPDPIVVTLGTAGEELHAEAASIDAAVAGARGAGCLVAVGSGTVCDIAKEASRILDAPYVVVQTANSVNAFSDDMAVLLVNGVKRTMPSRWPSALVIDLAVLGDAPPALNRAGVGELAAMFTAPADWRLAAAFGMDPTWDRRVVDLFRDGAAELLEAAPLATSHDPRGLRTLAELMTLSGLALGIAGRTSPISGTEHTVSHLLDMAAAREDRRTGLHGAQVGVAALAVSVAWRRILDSLDPEALVRAETPAASTMRARIDEAFRRLDPSGTMAAECWSQYRTKLARWDAARDVRSGVVAGWATIRAELEDVLGRPADIARALRAAGAAATFDELDPPATADQAAWALLNGHLIRDRFTLADHAWFGGAWSARIAAEAIEEASSIAASASTAPHAADDLPTAVGGLG